MRILEGIIDSYWKDLRFIVEQKEYKDERNKFREQKIQAVLDDQEIHKKISKQKFMGFLKTRTEKIKEQMDLSHQ
jgi:hypothetical protein